MGSSPALVRRKTTRSPSGDTVNDRGTPSANPRVRATCRGNSSSGSVPVAIGPGAYQPACPSQTYREAA